MDNELNLRQIQLEELKILKEITDYIDDKKLTYFISGGTLLGAIRHKGFIPWDDDVDVIMPRTEYEKLINYLINEPLKRKNLKVFSFELNNYKRPFTKIANTDINIKCKSKEDKYLYIDIFPIDGLSEDFEAAKKHIKKIYKYKVMMYVRTISFKELIDIRKSLIHKLLKLLLKLITYFIPMIFCAKKIDKLSRKYNYDDSKYVGTSVWPEGNKAIGEKKWYDNSISVEFEGYKFKTLAGWKYYLVTMYGDYMKIPPKELRLNHHIRAFRK